MKLAKNRLYRGDCLEVMQQLHGEGIAPDLIYLDPPFNSNRNYNIIFSGGGKGAQQTAFSDMWEKHYREETERDISAAAADIGVDGRLIKLLKSWADILGGGAAAEKGLFNYLLYMARLLVWCHKILAPGGSMYLHCDPTASHYLKTALDLIFGKSAFKNEIVWKRAQTAGRTSREVQQKFDAITDSILFYGKDGARVRKQKKETVYTEAEAEAKFHFDCKRKLFYKHAPRGNYSDASIAKFESEGRIYRTKTGTPRIKTFLAEKFVRGKKYIMEESEVANLWDDLPDMMHVSDAEKMGYNTQKPLALLERIVAASSDEGDLVFDPFCGCGTTMHAAHNLKRKWMGADISLDAAKHMKARVRKMALKEGKHYELIECGAQTREEYERLNPYEKQEWLVRQIGGVCGPKGGDGGADGVIRYHIGGDKWDFGEFIVSVKTGKQANPNMLDSLKGVMQKRGAKMGGLILDREPTSGMLDVARKSPKIKYKMKIMGEMQQISEHLSVQILTAAQILAGETFSTPPTLMDKKMAGAK